jgi:hypothetical protein
MDCRVAGGPEYEAVAVDVAGHHLGVAVAVGQRGAVLAPEGVPPRDPVELRG